MSTFYVPIYEWGPNPDKTYKSVTGLNMYLDLDDLYMSEPSAVGYMEVTGAVPTENEFRKKLKMEEKKDEKI